MDELRGQTAVVTGAASGIGRAIAERFLTEGMNLVLADIEEKALDATVKELGANGDVISVPTDVTDPASVEGLRDAALHRFGGVHVICNNAGVGGLGSSTWEGPLAAWEWVLGVNLWGVLHGVRTFVPLLIEQDAGRVVNTASLAGLAALPGMGPYSASKHAVLALSESLQLELVMFGSKVKVHVLCPGFLRTGIADSQRNWPARLGELPADTEMTSMLRQMVKDLVDEGLPPAAIADQLLDAMREDRFLVTTHQEQAEALADARREVVGGKEPAMPDIT